MLIEAKAQQGFDSTQMLSFRRDLDEVRTVTLAKRVRLAALASSLYDLPKEVTECFGGFCMHWKSLAGLYANNPKLLRADAIFEAGANRSAANNSSGYRTGAELLLAYEAGERIWVRRGGGTKGAPFQTDIQSGEWQTHMYETNRDAEAPPNRNWFSLDKFARRFRATK